MADIVLEPGDPKGEEALELLLRLAAAEKPTVSGPELSRAMNLLSSDAVLAAHFVNVAAGVARGYAWTLSTDHGGDFEDGLRSIEKVVGAMLRGESLPDDED